MERDAYCHSQHQGHSHRSINKLCLSHSHSQKIIRDFIKFRDRDRYITIYILYPYPCIYTIYLYTYIYIYIYMLTYILHIELDAYGHSQQFNIRVTVIGQSINYASVAVTVTVKR